MKSIPHDSKGEETPPAIEEVFAHALALAAEDRGAYLASACGGNDTLRAEVEALLAAHEAAEGGALLDTGALDAIGGGAAREAAERVAAEQAATAGDAQPGEWIGRYRLLERIGEGGFGTVWMAEQRQPIRRRVALKVIKLGMDTKRVVARFEQERQALALMEHPNIARVFDAGATPEGRPFFVMELVRGIKITDYCDKARLTTDERLRLFAMVCDALQHAHQKGVIHRDLKPSNVLVTLHDGVPVPKVIDFGVARATGQDPLTELTLFTQFHEMIGTPLYMSPEQAEMGGLDIDTRSDVYSLGILLYELLTGRTPLDPDSLADAGEAEMRRLIRQGEHPSPSTVLTTLSADARETVARNRGTQDASLRRNLRGDLDWIVMKALERDRNRRYESVHLLAEDLGRHLARKPVRARPPSQWYRFQRLVSRHKVASATTVAVTLILVAGIAVSLGQAARAGLQSERANRSLATLRSTAPAFAAQARSLFETGDIEAAMAQIDYAIKLGPDVPGYPLLKADLLMADFRFREAAEVYRGILDSDPQSPAVAASAALCQKLHRESAESGELSDRSVIDLHGLLRARSLPDALMAKIGNRVDEATRRILSETVGGKAEKFGKLPDGTWRLDLEGQPIEDLEPLRGLMISRLYLSDTPVTDLSPLAGMPLDVLKLHNTKIEDLSPLRDAPLRKICIPDNYRGDLSFLMEFRVLEQLHLPKRPANALSLRHHPSLTTMSVFNPTKQPAAHFLAGQLIREERYREALEILQEQGATESPGSYNWGGLAALLSAHGDRRDLARFVRKEVEHTLPSSDIATYLALHSLLPDPPALPIEEIEEIMIVAEEGRDVWLLLTQGLLEYRKGNLAESIDILEPHYLTLEGTLPAMAASILAMARAQLGDLAGAESALASSPAVWAEGIDSGWMWHNWMTYDQLRREAENLLESHRKQDVGK